MVRYFLLALGVLPSFVFAQSLTHPDWTKWECFDTTQPGSLLQLIVDAKATNQVFFQVRLPHATRSTPAVSPLLKGFYDLHRIDRKLQVNSNNPINHGRFDLGLTFETNRAELKIDGRFLKDWFPERAAEERLKIDWDGCKKVDQFSEVLITEAALNPITIYSGTARRQTVTPSSGLPYDVLVLKTDAPNSKEYLIQLSTQSDLERALLLRVFPDKKVNVKGEIKETRLVIADLSLIEAIVGQGPTPVTLLGRLSQRADQSFGFKTKDGTEVTAIIPGLTELELISQLELLSKHQVQLSGQIENGVFMIRKFRLADDCDPKLL